MRRKTKSKPPGRAVVVAVLVAVAGGVAAVLRRRSGSGGGGAASRPARETVDPGDTGGGPQQTELPHETFTCQCGTAFRVSGADRHRVYWLADAAPDDPVLDPTCPECGTELPRTHDVAL